MCIDKSVNEKLEINKSVLDKKFYNNNNNKNG